MYVIIVVKIFFFLFSFKHKLYLSARVEKKVKYQIKREREIMQQQALYFLQQQQQQVTQVPSFTS